MPIDVQVLPQQVLLDGLFTTWFTKSLEEWRSEVSERSYTHNFHPCNLSYILGNASQSLNPTKFFFFFKSKLNSKPLNFNHVFGRLCTWCIDDNLNKMLRSTWQSGVIWQPGLKACGRENFLTQPCQREPFDALRSLRLIILDSSGEVSTSARPWEKGAD